MVGAADAGPRPQSAAAVEDVQQIEAAVLYPPGGADAETFLKNHADAIIVCDSCVVATFSFWILYVFVVMEHLPRRIIHANVTAHPSAAWTLQQLCEAIPSDHTYRSMLHDRDATFSIGFDASVAGMGLEVIETPVRSPKRIRFAKG
jgi:hypothetical protein